MSATSDLLRGLAQLLADAGVATYKPQGGYTAGETAIEFKKMPASPDRCLVLSLYPVSADHITGLQVRARGKANAYLDADDLSGDTQAVLHGQRGLTFGTVQVELIAWRSGSPMGLDDAGRDEQVANYYLTTSLPATSLVDITT